VSAADRSPAGTTDEPPPASGDGGHSARDRALRRFDAARSRFERSWVGEVVAQLKALDFASWTTVFGAELLWSALPLLILLSSLADEKIDDDLSRHIGLDSKGAHIVESLFRSRPSHDVLAIATGLLFSVAGVISVVASLQVIYERLFEQKHRGWRDLPRYLVWTAVLLALLLADGSSDRPLRADVGPVVRGVLIFAVVSIFFAWTMHFLLAGRVSWRATVRPALVTGVLWVGLDLFSSLYFSSVIKDDSKTYGTIGVVFTLLTWFILIGGVIMLGAAIGAVWDERSGRLGPGSGGRMPEA
jgi:membrane protein